MITKRVKGLTQSALQIADGDLSHRVMVKGKDEIGELGCSFNRMADKLERMIRDGRELTANIFHELRSPLTRVRVTEELLKEKLKRGGYEGCYRHLDEIREDGTGFTGPPCKPRSWPGIGFGFIGGYV